MKPKPCFLTGLFLLKWAMVFRSDFRKINDYLWEIPKTFRQDMRVPARIYASEKMLQDILGDKSVFQLINGTTLPGIVKYGIAMPDCHQGYGVPIGFVGAIRASDGVISPGACGFDINCGMRLLKTEYKEEEIIFYLEKLAVEIQNQVPSGLGKGRRIKMNIREIDRILEQGPDFLFKKGYGEKGDIENCEAKGKLDWADVLAVSDRAKNRARDQVGTLGSGNHFLEIQKVAEIFDKETAEKFGLFENQIVIMIHTGSRGLGHQVCSDYLKTMASAMEKYGIKAPDKEFAYVPFSSKEGMRYFSAMAGAANYAWCNRHMIAHYVRQAFRLVLGKRTKLSLLYDVAHNIIKKENYEVSGKDTELLVHRKGAVRAFPGQPVLIPGSMGTFSYILMGTEKGKEAFFSSSHGAGRRMSRREAMRVISGKKVIEELKKKRIIVKCRSLRGIAEEAPLTYKDIDRVVEVVHRAGLSLKVARLVPLAVVKGE